LPARRFGFEQLQSLAQLAQLRPQVFVGGAARRLLRNDRGRQPRGARRLKTTD